VAHPDLVPVAKAVFDEHMPAPNQLDVRRDDVDITRDMMLEVHQGERTEAGLRENIRVGVQYIEAWLRGRGAVPLYNLMEDAATAEICRTQIWQWLKHGAQLSDGRTIDAALVEQLIQEELDALRAAITPPVFDSGRFTEAAALFRDMALSPTLQEFLTLPAYAALRD
jgi:malate synthase